jgi:hypothetical protein
MGLLTFDRRESLNYADLCTPIYVPFVIAVATVSVKMILDIDTVMTITAAVSG